jgi:preprotein translocase subunit SecE
VARDRKRAKQRRDRRGRAAGQGSTPTDPARESARATPSSQPARADIPGALDHASGEADEFDAALVRGAGGVPASPDTGLEDGLPAGAEDELQLPETHPGSGGDGARGGGDGAAALPARERAPGAPLRGGSRAVAFLQASWAELQRVQWPDRRQTTQATAVVLGFVVVAGAYLGFADYVAKEIVEFVL